MSLRRLTSLLSYQASALMGKSLFDYHHGGDSEYLSGAFKCCKLLFWAQFGCVWVGLSGQYGINKFRKEGDKSREPLVSN